MKNKTKKITAILIVLALILTTGITGAKNTLLLETVYNAEAAFMTPGADMLKMNFAWYYNTDSTGASVQIAKKADLDAGKMPSNAQVFNGNVSNATEGKTTNKVTVSGLTPNTEYAYRVGDSEKNSWDPINYFKTGDPESYEVIFVADVQVDSSITIQNWRNNLDKALQTAPNASFILNGGDNVNEGKPEENWTEMLSIPQLKSLPMVSTIGNHDIYTNFYSYRYNNPNSYPNQNFFLSYGNTLYIFINGVNRDFALHRQTVSDAVKSHLDAAWKVLTIHHDLYGGAKWSITGGDSEVSVVPMRNGLYPIIDEFEIDVVFSGHDHCFSRSHFMKDNTVQINQSIEDKDFLSEDAGTYKNPAGTLYIAGNTMTGIKYYNPNNPPSFWEAITRQLYLPEYMVISVTNTNFTIKTYRPDTQQLLDSIILAKDEKITQTTTIITTSLKGDINLDNKVNGMDLLLMKQNILGINGKELIKGTQPYINADMNDDGKINGIDLPLLKKKILS